MLPFAVQRIDHLVLRVQDTERSVAFFRKVLGCDVVRRRDELGLVHVRAGASMVDLISIDGPLGRRGGAGPAPEGRNVDHLCLRIEPYDEAALVQFLAAQGVEVTETTQRNFGAEGEGPSLYFHDPDGNLIELKGPAAA